MKKILYFDHHSSPSEYYRLLPLDYVKSPNFTVIRSTERSINMMTINEYDVVVFCRPTSQVYLNAIKLCRDQHKKTIVDFDDDCLNVPPTNPMYETYEAEKNNTIQCLMLADEVWVTTDGIKKSFSYYNKNIQVIPNALNDTIFPVKAKKPFLFNKLAMWRGGLSHIGDIYSPGITEYIISIINSNPIWKFYSLGQRFEFIEYRVTQGNYYRNDGASPIQFYKMMQEFRPCLFYYPLEPHAFNAGKSNCSLIESVYAGAAYFGNTLLPEFQKPGVMEFRELAATLRLPDKKLEPLLRKNHELSWKYIQENLLLSKVNEKRLERIERMIK